MLFWQSLSQWQQAIQYARPHILLHCHFHLLLGGPRCSRPDGICNPSIMLWVKLKVSPQLDMPQKTLKGRIQKTSLSDAPQSQLNPLEKKQQPV